MDYKELYNLKEAPFNLTPDPDFFFPSKTHQIALETLLYSIKSKQGFIQITGEPGTGKSMLLRKILREIEDSVVLCLLLHTNIKADALLLAIMQDLKIDISSIENPNQENLLSLFKEFLLKQVETGKHTIIIADEAQNMPDETLEELRMLSNLETEKTKLLQIILIGQIELEHIITPLRLSQLYQRITIRYRLNPLTQKETESYIFHRLSVASIDGRTHLIKFKSGVINQIFKWSKGIPRLINIISERALMASFITNSKQITKDHIKKGIVSIQGEAQFDSNNNSLATLGYILVFILITAGLWGFGRLYPEHDPFSIQPSTAKIKTINHTKITKPVKKIILEPDIKIPKNDFKTMPTDWVDLPESGGQIVILNKQTKNLSLWIKNKDEIIKTNEKSFDWILPSGIYMAGTDKNKNRFFFNPDVTYFMDIQLKKAELLDFIENNASNLITPVIVLNSLKDIQSLSDMNQLKDAVSAWENAWQDLNPDNFIKSFGNLVSIYVISEEQPVILSKKDILKLKKDIFRKSKYVNLNISNTLCMIDPLDHNKAYAIFSQEYNSKIHQDNGIKILYFKKIFLEHGSFDWKITGKLWLEGLKS